MDHLAWLMALQETEPAKLPGFDAAGAPFRTAPVRGAEVRQALARAVERLQQVEAACLQASHRGAEQLRTAPAGGGQDPAAPLFYGQALPSGQASLPGQASEVSPQALSRYFERDARRYG